MPAELAEVFCYREPSALVQSWRPSLLLWNFSSSSTQEIQHVLFDQTFWSVPNFVGCWALIQRAAEWPCCLCCCGRAAEMPLLRHKEEWNPLAMSACPSRACLYKGKTWLCPCRISLGKRKIPQRLYGFQKWCFSATLWRCNAFPGSLLEKCL